MMIASVWAQLGRNEEDLRYALEAALKLWGSASAEFRRLSMLKLTDPKFVYLLKDPKFVDESEREFLFGRSFMSKVIREVREDANLARSRTTARSSSNQGSGSK